MSCREVTEFLSDFLDGQLPLRQRVAFKLHLIFCPECRRYLDSHATTVELTRSLREEQAVEANLPIPNELVQAILAARGNTGTESAT